MDIKTQLFTLLMIKSYDVGFYTLLLLFGAFYAKDYVIKYLEYPEKINDSTNPTYDAAVKSNTNEGELMKTSSISIEIFLHKQNDTLAHSLLDYVTNKPNIQSISYSKNKFMLNHKNPILIEPNNSIYIQLLSEKGSDDEVSQVIEIYSYCY